MEHRKSEKLSGILICIHLCSAVKSREDNEWTFSTTKTLRWNTLRSRNLRFWRHRVRWRKVLRRTWYHPNTIPSWNSFVTQSNRIFPLPSHKHDTCNNDDLKVIDSHINIRQNSQCKKEVGFLYTALSVLEHVVTSQTWLPISAVFHGRLRISQITFHWAAAHCIASSTWEFRQYVYDGFYQSMLSLSRTLLEAFALSLPLPENYFRAMLGKLMVTMRLLYSGIRHQQKRIDAFFPAGWTRFRWRTISSPSVHPIQAGRTSTVAPVKQQLMWLSTDGKEHICQVIIDAALLSVWENH